MSMFRKRPGRTVRPIRPVRPSGVLCAVGFLVAGAAVFWGSACDRRAESGDIVLYGHRPGRSHGRRRAGRSWPGALGGRGDLRPGPGNSPCGARATKRLPLGPKRNRESHHVRGQCSPDDRTAATQRRASCRQCPQLSRRRHESGCCRSETESSREGRGNHAAGWAVDFHLVQRIAARRLGAAGQRPGRVLCRAVSGRMATTRGASPCRGARCLGACRARAARRPRADGLLRRAALASTGRRSRNGGGVDAADEGDLAAESIARPAAVAAASKPAVSDNPAPLELATRLTELQRRHAELLIDRTPLHPEVQNVATKIAALEAQLATLAKSVPIGAGEDPRLAGPSRQPIRRRLPSRRPGRRRRARTSSPARQPSRNCAGSRRPRTEPARPSSVPLPPSVGRRCCSSNRPESKSSRRRRSSCPRLNRRGGHTSWRRWRPRPPPAAWAW